MAPVNFLAILVATIASMVVGGIWYGPLFGKLFMAAMGMNEWSPEKQAKMKKMMPLSYAGQALSSFVMFFFLAGLIVGFGQKTLAGGLWVAFTIWLGFVMPMIFGELLWGGKKSLFWLKSGNMLITLLVAGAILGAW